jgi:radical SAM superfamily enzyme YgiQ (UPF0313 family)
VEGCLLVLLYLINPRNATIYFHHYKKNFFSKYRVWKPLGLGVVAQRTPPEWQVRIVDENVSAPDYDSLPRPDLVGLTAFTSQATRAYELGDEFRRRGVPVVMGGIHATMCLSEALEHVDAVVTGEAEAIWEQVLQDFRAGALQRVYQGGPVEASQISPARHELLPGGFAFGSIQTTRGCPLNCTFCSVTAFNGRRFRLRPVEDVVEEFERIREKRVLIVDDNLCGTSRAHMARAKELFRAMIDAKLNKKWICQATLNMADDEELVRLAARSGCFGVLIGYESVSEEGLAEINKKFNVRSAAAIKASVRRLQRYGIAVMGSFIFGLDIDRKGVGLRAAEAADAYGLDGFNLQFMTPLPGTRLWEEMEAQGRIAANSFPEDWQYYILCMPVAHYMHLSWDDMVDEYLTASRAFYSYPRIVARFLATLLHSRKPLPAATSLVMNLLYRRDLPLNIQRFNRYGLTRGAVPFARQTVLKEKSSGDRSLLPQRDRPSGVPDYQVSETLGGPSDSAG